MGSRSDIFHERSARWIGCIFKPSLEGICAFGSIQVVLCYTCYRLNCPTQGFTQLQIFLLAIGQCAIIMCFLFTAVYLSKHYSQKLLVEFVGLVQISLAIAFHQFIRVSLYPVLPVQSCS